MEYIYGLPGKSYRSENCTTSTPPPPPPPDPGRPVGSFEYLYYSPGGIRLKGWTADPDAGTTPIDFQVKIDVTYFPQQKANLWRPDVNDPPENQRYGEYHGFDVTMPLGTGTHRICVVALNYGIQLYGQEIGCRDITTNGQTVGNLEETVGGGRVVWVKGWTLDTEGSAPIEVHMYVGQAGYVKLADHDRPDLGATHTQYGARHGFGYYLPAPPGLQRVCVYGINTGAGTNFEACRDVIVGYEVGENARDLPSGVNGVQAFRNAYDAYGGAGIIGLAENPVHPDPRGIAQLQDTRGGTHRRGLLVQRGLYPVFIVSGDHRDYLENVYGGSVFDTMGYPRNNNHAWGNGRTQDFNGGKLGEVLLMKGNNVGRVYKIFGGIRQEYVNRYGGAPGRLGYPVSDEYAWNGEIHQGFEGGWIQWIPGANTSRVVWK